MRPSIRPVLLLPILAFLLLVGGYAAHRGPPPGHARTYYVAADEVAWDYAPSGSDQIKDRPFDDTQRPFVEAGPHWVGHVAMKALYREYTDSTFKTLKPRPAAWQHLGLLGPVLRAEVGDTIRVLFRNNTRFPVSMHPHGVLYGKDSEGASYSDKTQTADKSGVPTGGVHVYVWPVPERAGPGRGDPSSILWMYHSHVKEGQDPSTGLLGPIIITARGRARPDGSPKDVDREVVVAFDEIDEASSHYLMTNLRRYATHPESAQVAMVFALPQVVPPPVGQFNFKETMNGFMYGNGPLPTMRVGERVRWYLMASTGFEIHAPHWHGNTVQIARMRTDVTALLPMGMVVADMVPDNPGIWLFHCHLSNHLLMGMQSRYEVRPASAP